MGTERAVTLLPIVTVRSRVPLNGAGGRSCVPAGAGVVSRDAWLARRGDGARGGSCTPGAGDPAARIERKRRGVPARARAARRALSARARHARSRVMTLPRGERVRRVLAAAFLAHAAHQP